MLSPALCVRQGERNAGFDVLYHNMKHGQISTKELAEFVRERAAVEESYSKSMSKLSKMASSSSQLGERVLPPVQDRLETKEEVTGTLEAVQSMQVSSSHLHKARESYLSRCLEHERLRKEGANQKEVEKAEAKSKKAAEMFSACVEKYNRVGGDFERKMSESAQLALCHLELTRKLSDLIREINKYGDEQVKVHRKTKEEVTGTLEAVQSMQVSSSHLHKARESYLSRCLEHERLRKEGANQKEVEKAEAKSKKAAEMFSACVEKYNRVGGDFERKMSESAQKFQEIEEAHLRQMKVLIKSYSHSIEDTHVQVGQVHEEFKQNVENIGVDNLIQKFSDQKGTGRDRPGSTTAVFAPSELQWEVLFLSLVSAGTVQLGFLDSAKHDKESNFYSSDSDFDDDEPKKFHVQIHPPASGSCRNSAATEQELKATVGALTLPPNRVVGNEHDRYRRCASSPVPNRLISAALPPEPLFGPPLESAFKHSGFTGRCARPLSWSPAPPSPPPPPPPPRPAPVSGGSTPPHLAPPAPHESDPDSKDFWLNMQALTLHLQREAELNPQASYYNVGLLKYQVSSQDPGCAPLHLSARCQCSGSLTRVSLDYHCCPASPATELSNVQVVISLEDSATDVHCQPPGVWNAEERRLLWKLHNLSPTADGKGAGTVCASWQCRDVLRGALPSVGVQFVGSGEALSGVDLELVGGRYRMSLVKKRFATGNWEDWAPALGLSV
ncbi:UNVERIFIED_CONTAM: hypothetical protein FKN15_072242 [Acipenser sinensis]